MKKNWGKCNTIWIGFVRICEEKNIWIGRVPLCRMENELELSAGEAWLDFYRNVYPNIKAGMEWHERKRISQANSDFNGRRKRVNGKPQRLGPERIADILMTYAPGRYRVEYRVAFFRVDAPAPVE